MKGENAQLSLITVLIWSSEKNLCNRQLYMDMMHLMSCNVRLLELAMFACYGATIMLELLNACEYE